MAVIRSRGAAALLALLSLALASESSGPATCLVPFQLDGRNLCALSSDAPLSSAAALAAHIDPHCARLSDADCAVLRAAAHDAWLLRSGRLSKGAFFDRIYERGVWSGSGSRCPLSGCGSGEVAAAEAAEALLDVLRAFQVASVLDLGSGDQTWMRTLDLGAHGVRRYVGGDVSERAVSAAAATSAAYGRNGREFVVLDATSDPLPELELVVSRQMMQHMHNRDVLATLRNIARGGSRFALLSTSIRMNPADWNGRREGVGLAEGSWVNLMLPPFCLTPPARLYRDGVCGDSGHCEEQLHYLGLWALDEKFAPGVCS